MLTGFYSETPSGLYVPFRVAQDGATTFTSTDVPEPRVQDIYDAHWLADWTMRIALLNEVGRHKT